MERLIDKFVEKVLNTTESFMLESGNCDTDKKYYFFIQCNVGKAKYIYGEYSYIGKNFHTDLSLKPELVAIVSDEKVYIVDDYQLEVWQYENLELPKNTYHITDIVIEKNKYAESVIFANFYESLETHPILDAHDLKACINEARKVLFSKTPVLNMVTIQPMFNTQDIADFLCGIINLEDEAMKRLLKYKDRGVHEKSCREKVKELMENHSVAEDYEMEIAKGIRSVDAKTVTVEFELNGKRASAKINPEKIIQCMQNNDYFDGYDFASVKCGDELIKKLDAATCIWNSDGKKVLTCDDITKITYGKKELYVRKQL